MVCHEKKNVGTLCGLIGKEKVGKDRNRIHYNLVLERGQAQDEQRQGLKQATTKNLLSLM